ncbi:phage head completion protein [Patiriisocius marinus]|uniref:phage head completion protein n=1 Tax=Patiriisocius marinus TaxID=1397112 RepID=UPI00232CFF71|nr:hypothetical protein [Patiriisocius marinus]
MAKTLFAGELNAPIQLLEQVTVQNSHSESVKTWVVKSTKFSKRIDAGGSEELDGRLIALSVCKYIIRYDAEILKTGTQLAIRDIDGDYDIHSVAHYGTQRNKFIEIKCSKRGD